MQFVTFRLADSLPAAALGEFQRDLDLKPSNEELRQYMALLDEGYGACVLADPRAQAIVIEALRHFHGSRYLLHAFVVMPNHVHVLVDLAPGESLGQILHSWKSYSGNAINKVLGRSGPLWNKSYFDRYIRDSEHYDRVVRYIHANPVNAKLVQIATEWAGSSALGWSLEEILAWYQEEPWASRRLF
ncbi:MAG: transposase [bacterium]